jgi:hypothetical protein
MFQIIGDELDLCQCRAILITPAAKPSKAPVKLMTTVRVPPVTAIGLCAANLATSTVVVIIGIPIITNKIAKIRMPENALR